MISHSTTPVCDENVSLARDILDSLLGSINDLKSSVGNLRESVSKLQEENNELRDELQSTKTDLTILRENSGVKFPQFTKLPVELRRMIWQSACLAPQIHILRDDWCSKSRINTVMETCREARSAALELRLDYFCIGTSTWPACSVEAGALKSYVNRDLDTFWLKPGDWTVHFPLGLEWFCGLCDSMFGYISLCPRCKDISGVRDPEGIRSVALDFMFWEEPDTEGEAMDLATVETCEQHDVKELLLVVGDYKPLQNERDVVFVAASGSPWHMYRHLPQVMAQVTEDPPSEGVQILQSSLQSWKELEDILTKRVEAMKVKRAKDRQLAVETGEVSSFEELDSDPFVKWPEFRDISKWQVPKIRFVEARKDTRKWIMPIERPPRAREEILPVPVETEEIVVA